MQRFSSHPWQGFQINPWFSSYPTPTMTTRSNFPRHQLLPVDQPLSIGHPLLHLASPSNAWSPTGTLPATRPISSAFGSCSVFDRGTPMGWDLFKPLVFLSAGCVCWNYWIAEISAKAFFSTVEYLCWHLLNFLEKNPIGLDVPTVSLTWCNAAPILCWLASTNKHFFEVQTRGDSTGTCPTALLIRSKLLCCSSSHMKVRFHYSISANGATIVEKSWQNRR